MNEIKPITSRPEVDPEILKRVQRWQEEQKARKDKQDRRKKEAEKRGISVSQMLAQRREKYLLKNCRATLSEIIKAHPLKDRA